MLGRQRRGDPRLEHAVPVGHPAGPRVEGRLVERMGDRTHQAPHGTPRQPSISVERYHVAHVRRRS